LQYLFCINFIHIFIFKNSFKIRRSINLWSWSSKYISKILFRINYYFLYL